MRTLVSGVLLIAITSSLEAQVRDSTYWMIGVTRSFMDGNTLASRASQSGGSMQFEWRTEGRRLGIRTEIGVAQENRYFDAQSDGSICAGCFADQRRSNVMALTSAVYEWRQDRTVRPYVIGGAGIARFAYRNNTNFTNSPGDGAVQSPTPRREAATNVGFVTAYGLGASVNGERFGAFTELRGRAGGGGGLGERFSVGVRVRPN